MQTIESANKGVDIKSKAKAWFKLEECKTAPEKTAPKKVLPTSPINTFAGDQFQRIKPVNAPTNEK